MVKGNDYIHKIYNAAYKKCVLHIWSATRNTKYGLRGRGAVITVYYLYLHVVFDFGRLCNSKSERNGHKNPEPGENIRIYESEFLVCIVRIDFRSENGVQVLLTSLIAHRQDVSFTEC